MDTKPIWQSKTFWFNLLAAVVVIATMFGYGDFLPDAEWMAAVIAVANLVLRYLTTQPVELKLK